MKAAIKEYVLRQIEDVPQIEHDSEITDELATYDSRSGTYKRIEYVELDQDELNIVILTEQLKHLRTIKKMLTFFTAITVAGMAMGLILFFTGM